MRQRSRNWVESIIEENGRLLPCLFIIIILFIFPFFWMHDFDSIRGTACLPSLPWSSPFVGLHPSKQVTSQESQEMPTSSSASRGIMKKAGKVEGLGLEPSSPSASLKSLRRQNGHSKSSQKWGM
jgi:hypothetical protein